jgi:hypothetical protein
MHVYFAVSGLKIMGHGTLTIIWNHPVYIWYPYHIVPKLPTIKMRNFELNIQNCQCRMTCVGISRDAKAAILTRFSLILKLYYQHFFKWPPKSPSISLPNFPLRSILYNLSVEPDSLDGLRTSLLWPILGNVELWTGVTLTDKPVGPDCLGISACRSKVLWQFISVRWNDKWEHNVHLLRGLSPQANYTDQATAACRRS